MNHQYIAEMVQVLNPVLKNPGKAQILLERYWQNRQAIVWNIEQVHRAANERELALTNEEARQILQALISRHNPQHGLNWQMVVDLIEEKVVGRKLTRQEVRQFVKQDILTIRST